MNKQPKAIHAADLDLSTVNTGERWEGSWLKLSIQQKLPFYIFVLMVTVITTFSWVSYLAVRKAGMGAGTDRVTALADKLSIMFKGSVDRFSVSARALSDDKNIRQFLTSPGNKTRSGALSVFHDFLRTDTTNKAVELLDANKNKILGAGNQQLFEKTPGVLNGNSVGRIINRNDNMYFPVFAPVITGGKIKGYIINWKHLYATREGIEQFRQLVGSNGKLYFGNDDGRFWTDLMKPVEGPPVGLNDLRKVVEYDRNDSGHQLGSARNIPGSPWVVLVELSSTSFLETSRVFLRWVAIIGLLLIAIGSFGGWLLSRSITRPLALLDNAASEMAGGNYAVEVPIYTTDELGRLAASFNTMTQRVRTAQNGLQRQVHETSKELETAITDIHEQKEYDRKKDEFISLASHELKTPLTTIKAFFQLVVNDVPAAARSFPLIDKASRQVNRLERLISDLLDVSKIMEGQMNYKPEQFDFDALLKETMEVLYEVYPDRDLILEKSVQVRLTADRQRIEQVIINLLNNAVKYSPAGGQVLIRSEIVNGDLQVTIKDFGIGIEEKDMDKLFEKFNRIDTGHRFQGMGLGLFISAEIIRYHGGGISAESAPGKGSTFTFYMPINTINA